MPGDSYYWSPTENERDNPFVEKDTYIDPWDLENYAYIREHLDSMELSSSHSGPSLSLREFAEPTSSFNYVPVKRSQPEDRLDSILSDQENYTVIEDLQQSEEKYGRTIIEMQCPFRRRMNYDYEDTEMEGVSPYAEEVIQEKSSLFGVYDKKGMFRRVAVPLAFKTRNRNFSFSNEDFNNYTRSNSNADSQSSVEEHFRPRYETTIPIYDDLEKFNRNKPHFGFSKNGHLKIDYSYSWSHLYKFIK